MNTTATSKMTQQWLNSVGEQALDLDVNLHIYDAFGEMELGELVIILGLGKSEKWYPTKKIILTCFSTSAISGGNVSGRIATNLRCSGWSSGPPWLAGPQPPPRRSGTEGCPPTSAHDSQLRGYKKVRSDTKTRFEAVWKPLVKNNLWTKAP